MKTHKFFSLIYDQQLNKSPFPPLNVSAKKKADPLLHWLFASLKLHENMAILVCVCFKFEHGSIGLEYVLLFVHL